MRLLLALVLLALVLAACGHDDEPVAAGAGPGGVALADEYVSFEVTAGGEPRPLVPGTSILLTFRGDDIGASLGCNHLGGRFSVDGTTLVVEELAMTEMGCDPALHDQDRWFADLLTSRPQILTSGDELQINDGHTTVVLREAQAAEPDEPLLGTTWQVDGFLEGTGPDGTAMSIAVERPATLQLLENGLVVGSDGCNGFGYATDDEGSVTDALRWDLDGDRISFSGGAVQTQVGCEGAQAEHARRSMLVLSGSVTWSVDGDRLTLVDDDGRGVTYRAVDT